MNVPKSKKPNTRHLGRRETRVRRNKKEEDNDKDDDDKVKTQCQICDDFSLANAERGKPYGHFKIENVSKFASASYFSNQSNHIEPVRLSRVKETKRQIHFNPLTRVR